MAGTQAAARSTGAIPVTRTPAFADAVAVGGVAVLLAWPVTWALARLRRRRR